MRETKIEADTEKWEGMHKGGPNEVRGQATGKPNKKIAARVAARTDDFQKTQDKKGMKAPGSQNRHKIGGM